ncbi:MAG: SurA N-terminal domain-containing protein, partial [Calditrichaeota bacterium]|nr:SurA N-terminal domain-containing protein [Calditrichota bacterium]
MMGKMRDMTKWILYILILAFVGLMVIEWGADYSGLMQQQQSVVGEINGEEVSLQQYTMAVSNARAMEERRTGNTLDEAAVADLRDRVWEELVQRVVLKTQLEKMDISVTDDDVTNYILNSLTQQYSNDPNFQTNGRFDRDKLNQVLTQPENANLLISMEYQAKEDLPYAKLVDLINASVIVTEQELRDEFAQTNQKAKIDFVGVATTAFRNDSLNISDADLKAYYDKNKDDFKVEETRKLKYVFFSKTPTAEDSARVVDAINQLKAEAESGKDFATLALTESEDPSAQTNSGDLGFFDRNAMVKEFADAAFSAEPGTFVG